MSCILLNFHWYWKLASKLGQTCTIMVTQKIQLSWIFVLRGRIALNFFAKNVKIVCVVKSSNIELYMESFYSWFFVISKSNCRHLYFEWPNRCPPLIWRISEVPVKVLSFKSIRILAGNSHIHLLFQSSSISLAVKGNYAEKWKFVKIFRDELKVSWMLQKCGMEVELNFLINLQKFGFLLGQQGLL